MKLIGFLLALFPFAIYAQDYPPAAEQPGSTAIPAASELFVAWATGIEVVRGPVDISRPDFEQNGSNYASHGQPEDALGPATNNVVSLGDAGIAILTFAKPITNGPGFDFAVFENSFDDTFLELAFVEVSSNGVDYFRFPSHSQTQTETQIAAFDPIDPTYINNLAGKYRAFFGTPFDLSDLEDNALLDKSRITHIKIIDVVGSIDPAYARYDSYGNIINDPFSTPFPSSGFDLDAVGVINQRTLSVENNLIAAHVIVYPNPANDHFYIKSPQIISKVKLLDIQGRIVLNQHQITQERKLDISQLQAGVYVLVVESENKSYTFKLIKN